MEIDQLIVEAAVKAAVAEKAVVREDVDGEPWLYLTGLYRAEVGLAQSVHRIASATPHPLPVIDVEKAIGWVEGKLGIKLALGQQEANSVRSQTPRQSRWPYSRMARSGHARRWMVRPV